MARRAVARHLGAFVSASRCRSSALSRRRACLLYTSVAAFVEELDRASRWATAHPAELAALFSAATGVDPDVEKIVAARDIYTIDYLDSKIVHQQQGIADAFQQLGLIPHAVDVHAIAYVPSAKARAALAQINR